MKVAPSNKRGGKKGKWACFNCRLCFKETTVCPSCKAEMYDVGPRFRAPPRRDIREWAVMKVWWIDTRVVRGRNGIWLGHGPKQNTLREQKQQLAKDREYSHSHKIPSKRRWEYKNPLYKRLDQERFPYVTFK